MMSDQPHEDLLAMAQRHVLEGEARVARQEELVAALRRDGHDAAAARGDQVLVQMRRALDLGRRHLEFELAKRSRDPAQQNKAGQTIARSD
jgi:hypothetical protein